MKKHSCKDEILWRWMLQMNCLCKGMVFFFTSFLFSFLFFFFLWQRHRDQVVIRANLQGRMMSRFCGKYKGMDRCLTLYPIWTREAYNVFSELLQAPMSPGQMARASWAVSVLHTLPFPRAKEYFFLWNSGFGSRTRHSVHAASCSHLMIMS